MKVATTEVKHIQNRFYIVTNGMESHMDYEIHEPSTVVFYHTYVPEELRGKGLAKEMIREGLDWAMSEHLEIIPACSAVRRFIDMNDNYKAYFNK